MSDTTLIPWQNRLAKLIQQPGGSKVAEVLQRADDNLETIRANCLLAVDRQLEEITRLRADAGPNPSLEVKDAVYQLASDIHGVAGVFGLEALGQAAFSLCELADRLRRSDRWSQDAIDVHIAALRLLRHPEGAVDGAQMLEGLHKVLDRFPKTADESSPA